MLVASGAAYRRVDGPAPKAAAAATLALFWGVSGALYLDRGWTRPFWRVLRARSGRDWMINSGVLDLPYRRVGPGTHAAAILIFATYPLWLKLGWTLARDS